MYIPQGCADATLSTSGTTTTNQLPMRVLLPFPTTATTSSTANAPTAVINPVAHLATAVYLATANGSAPRYITPADYARVYEYFGVGLAGASDAVPPEADFVRQNWLASTSVLDARVQLLNMRVLAALGPTSYFVSGGHV